MDTREARGPHLTALGATPSEVEELLAYTDNHFHPESLASGFSLPLAPEPHVAVWEEYAAAVEAAGSIDPLRDALVQLRFPIREGISGSDEYCAATRRGVVPRGDSNDGVRCRGLVRLTIHDHPGGRIPAFITSDRDDFVTLVRAFTERNEPAPVPASQGAAVVTGFNNWDRIRRYRARWEADHPAAGDTGWQAEFARIVPEKWRYQDRFLIVSNGPYSGVPAAEVGLDDETWCRRSVTLRLAHEAAHYFTKRVFGSMKNQVHDELIADWAGIRAAAGRYRADWFHRFMGLESFPQYREGGRLQNYRTSPAPLSDGAFRVLQTVTYQAAITLERFESARHDDPADPRAVAIGLIRLALVTLDELASDGGCERLADAQREAERVVRWQSVTGGANPKGLQ